MATEASLVNISVAASADLSANQFRFHTIGATGMALAGAGVLTDGVLQDTPNALGVHGALCVSGVSKVVAGAAVLAGAEVASDATGRAVTAVSTDHYAGRAITAAGAAGDIISVLLNTRAGVKP
jgi:hypothetical protein